MQPEAARLETIGDVGLQRADGRGVAHARAGAVSDSPAQLRPSVGAGTGVRYTTPIGPLQADIAYGFKTKSFRLHLTVGVTF